MTSSTSLLTPTTAASESSRVRFFFFHVLKVATRAYCMIEFDMPAHSTAWGFGYPFMTVQCAKRQSPYDFNDPWGDQPMDPTNPKVYDFLEKFLEEVANLFPDNWIHLV